MDGVQLKLDANGKGVFFIEEDGEHVAVMDVAVSEKMLTVYHTQVVDRLKGKGIASKLFTAVVDYARKQKLKVNPLCQYVFVQFDRHPERYADIWVQY